MAAWIRFEADGAHLKAAQALREERQEEIGGGYDEEVGDRRWLSELSAALLSGWLRAKGVGEEEARWRRKEHPFAPDFVVGGKAVSVRTRSADRMHPNYCVSLLPRHAPRDDHDIVFFAYEKGSRDVLLLGAMAQPAFLRLALQYQRGELVHEGLQARADSYEVPVGALTNPGMWLCGRHPELPGCPPQQMRFA